MYFEQAERPDAPGSAALLERIGTAFPALAIRTSRLERSGGDHLVLIVNDELVFRFPRPGFHDLALELEVLRALRRQTRVVVPDYTYVDPAARFAGYPIIAGEALTDDRFARLDMQRRAHVLDAVAKFLPDLHGLPRTRITWSGDWPKAWTAAQFADRGLNDRLPLIAKRMPQLADPVAAFYGRYRWDKSDRPVILHGDLVGDHILINHSGSLLAGIIDFGDVALGDPAQDLSGLWSYGEEAVSRVVGMYDSDRVDPGLLDRSRNHFIRYRIDQLFERLRNGVEVSKNTCAAALEAMLATSK